MRVQVGCELLYDTEVATHAVIQVEPQLDGGVRALDERWANTPQIGMSRFMDSYGNVCRLATIPAGVSSLRCDALLEVPDTSDPQPLDAAEVAREHLPDGALLHTLPAGSAHPRSSPTTPGACSVRPPWLETSADDLRLGTRRGQARVSQHSPLVTALDVFNSRAGVCRDFAHLAVTFCRALSIPARYVFGYLPDIDVPVAPEPMDFGRCSSTGHGGHSIPATTNDGSAEPSSLGSATPRRRHDLHLPRARTQVYDRVGDQVPS